jgi:hypothetical protein
VNSATSATTTFTRTASGTNGGQLYSGTYRCTVTDSQARVTSVDVTVNTTHTNTYVTLTSGASGNASGSCSTNNGNGCTSTTNSVTVTAYNGAPGYSYAWSYLSGTGFTVNSPTSAATSFSLSAAGSPAGTGYSAWYRCTVTDSIGATSAVDVYVSTTHTDSYVAMSVNKSTDCYGSCSYTSGGSCAAGTNWVDITVSGGLAPFTYSWAYYSGTVATISDGTAASVWFSREAAGTQTLGGWHSCTVYDATGRAASVVVYVQTTHTLSYTAMSLGKSGDSYGNYWCDAQPPVVNCPLTANIGTNSVSISVSGGVGPYSYSWSFIGGNSLSINSPSSAATAFSMLGVERNAYNSGTVRCTVTDSTSATAYIDVGVAADYSYTEYGA